MHILLIGNGGREHALAWKIAQSPLCRQLYVAPGNPGTGAIARNIDILADDFPAIADFCVENSIDLVVVGPEGPLVAGIRDFLEADTRLSNLLIVGPDRQGAQPEGSKDFSQQFMLRNGIPTAKARTFSADDLDEALAYIDECKPPVVLKADGLAGGKGVVIALSQAEAHDAIREMLVDRKFGDASARVLIEEFLAGIELSVFVLTDGLDYVILPEAKDYKRIGEGDTGPNTGGMGAVSPVVFATPNFMEKVESRVVKPTIEALKREGITYKGFIFVGLMNVGGEPFVIEYNCRMGDPETQVVMPRIDGDFVELLVAAAKGDLQGKKVAFDPRHAVTIALVSGGYPGSFEKGKVISGLEGRDEALVFHAGTRHVNGRTVTAGGRVLAITGRADSLEAARKQAYDRAAAVAWDGLYFRSDIGVDLLNYKEN